MNQPASAPDHAGVKVPPPLYLLGSITVGYGLEWCWPSPSFGGVWLSYFGGLLMAVAVAVVWHLSRRFSAADTDIKPWKPSSFLIQDHLYRYSRNPIYLSFLVFGIGLGLVLDSLWVLAMQLVLWWALSRWVISREEAYLLRRFGKHYQHYQQQVRRWF